MHWTSGRNTPWTVCSPSHTIYSHIHTWGNLAFPVSLNCMSLDCGRKPEYLEETQVNTARTCKLHTERPWLGFTPNHLVVRQQYYLLHHHATP
uniref:Uncharacterized protein n=1 Tax=Anguilla anguilla TaxID=7936 RepID=A0A0E9PIQ2_ANGAN